METFTREKIQRITTQIRQELARHDITAVLDADDLAEAVSAVQRVVDKRIDQHATEPPIALLQLYGSKNQALMLPAAYCPTILVISVHEGARHWKTWAVAPALIHQTAGKALQTRGKSRKSTQDWINSLPAYLRDRSTGDAKPVARIQSEINDHLERLFGEVGRLVFVATDALAITEVCAAAFGIDFSYRIVELCDLWRFLANVSGAWSTLCGQGLIKPLCGVCALGQPRRSHCKAILHYGEEFCLQPPQDIGFNFDLADVQSELNVDKPISRQSTSFDVLPEPSELAAVAERLKVAHEWARRVWEPMKQLPTRAFCLMAIQWQPHVWSQIKRVVSRHIRCRPDYTMVTFETSKPRGEPARKCYNSWVPYITAILDPSADTRTPKYPYWPGVPEFALETFAEMEKLFPHPAAEGDLSKPIDLEYVTSLPQQYQRRQYPIVREIRRNRSRPHEPRNTSLSLTYPTNPAEPVPKRRSVDVCYTTSDSEAGEVDLQEGDVSESADLTGGDSLFDSPREGGSGRSDLAASEEYYAEMDATASRNLRRSSTESQGGSGLGRPRKSSTPIKVVVQKMETGNETLQIDMDTVARTVKAAKDALGPQKSPSATIEQSAADRSAEKSGPSTSEKSTQPDPSALTETDLLEKLFGAPKSKQPSEVRPIGKSDATEQQDTTIHPTTTEPEEKYYGFGLKEQTDPASRPAEQSEAAPEATAAVDPSPTDTVSTPPVSSGTAVTRPPTPGRETIHQVPMAEQAAVAQQAGNTISQNLPDVYALAAQLAHLDRASRSPPKIVPNTRKVASLANPNVPASEEELHQRNADRRTTSVLTHFYKLNEEGIAEKIKGIQWPLVPDIALYLGLPSEGALIPAKLLTLQSVVFALCRWGSPPPSTPLPHFGDIAIFFQDEAGVYLDLVNWDQVAQWFPIPMFRPDHPQVTTTQIREYLIQFMVRRIALIGGLEFPIHQPSLTSPLPVQPPPPGFPTRFNFPTLALPSNPAASGMSTGLRAEATPTSGEGADAEPSESFEVELLTAAELGDLGLSESAGEEQPARKSTVDSEQMLKDLQTEESAQQEPIEVDPLVENRVALTSTAVDSPLVIADPAVSVADAPIMASPPSAYVEKLEPLYPTPPDLRNPGPSVSETTQRSPRKAATTSGGLTSAAKRSAPKYQPKLLARPRSRSTTDKDDPTAATPPSQPERATSEKPKAESPRRTVLVGTRLQSDHAQGQSRNIAKVKQASQTIQAQVEQSERPTIWGKPTTWGAESSVASTNVSRSSTPDVCRGSTPTNPDPTADTSTPTVPNPTSDTSTPTVPNPTSDTSTPTVPNPTADASTPTVPNPTSDTSTPTVPTPTPLSIATSTSVPTSTPGLGAKRAEPDEASTGTTGPAVRQRMPSRGQVSPPVDRMPERLPEPHSVPSRADLEEIAPYLMPVVEMLLKFIPYDQNEGIALLRDMNRPTDSELFKRFRSVVMSQDWVASRLHELDLTVVEDFEHYTPLDTEYYQIRPVEETAGPTTSTASAARAESPTISADQPASSSDTRRVIPRESEFRKPAPVNKSKRDSRAMPSGLSPKGHNKAVKTKAGSSPHSHRSYQSSEDDSSKPRPLIPTRHERYTPMGTAPVQTPLGFGQSPFLPLPPMDRRQMEGYVMALQAQNQNLTHQLQSGLMEASTVGIRSRSPLVAGQRQFQSRSREQTVSPAPSARVRRSRSRKPSKMRRADRAARKEQAGQEASEQIRPEQEEPPKADPPEQEREAADNPSESDDDLEVTDEIISDEEAEAAADSDSFADAEADFIDLEYHPPESPAAGSRQEPDSDYVQRLRRAASGNAKRRLQSPYPGRR